MKQVTKIDFFICMYRIMYVVYEDENWNPVEYLSFKMFNLSVFILDITIISEYRICWHILIWWQSYERLE